MCNENVAVYLGCKYGKNVPLLGNSKYWPGASLSDFRESVRSICQNLRGYHWVMYWADAEDNSGEIKDDSSYKCFQIYTQGKQKKIYIAKGLPFSECNCDCSDSYATNSSKNSAPCVSNFHINVNVNKTINHINYNMPNNSDQVVRPMALEKGSSKEAADGSVAVIDL